LIVGVAPHKSVCLSTVTAVLFCARRGSLTGHIIYIYTLVICYYIYKKISVLVFHIVILAVVLYWKKQPASVNSNLNATLVFSFQTACCAILVTDTQACRHI